MEQSVSWAVSGRGSRRRSHTVIRAQSATASSRLRGGRVEHGGPRFPSSGIQWGGRYLESELSKKCEALAVQGLSELGDSLEIISPIEIIKDLFKLPYSNAPLSIRIHRVGSTLVLSTGADSGSATSEASGKELQPSFFSHMLSNKSSTARQGSSPAMLSYLLECEKEGFDATLVESDDLVFGSFSSEESEGFRTVDGTASASSSASMFTETTSTSMEDAFRESSRDSDTGQMFGPLCQKQPHVPEVKKVSEQSDQQAGSANIPRGRRSAASQPRSEHPDEAESEGDDYPFARVVVWNFDMWRMLLGSDLVVFSNKDHNAVSLHLVELSLESSPLLWLDIWLENVMAGVPEVAICYHHKEMVHGYELLRTDDISQIKALKRDGSPSFHPGVVEQCALMVLNFIRTNCTKSPGTYLLTKGHGNATLELHDYTVPLEPKQPGDRQGIVPRLRSVSKTFPMAMLVYRLAQRLSRRQGPGDSHQSARYYHEALKFLDHEEHPGICAAAHEFLAEHCLKHSCVLGSSNILLLEGPSREDTEAERSSTAAGLPGTQEGISSPDQTGDQALARIPSLGPMEAEKCSFNPMEPSVLVEGTESLGSGALAPEGQLPSETRSHVAEVTNNSRSPQSSPSKTSIMPVGALYGQLIHEPALHSDTDNAQPRKLDPLDAVELSSFKAQHMSVQAEGVSVQPASLPIRKALEAAGDLQPTSDPAVQSAGQQSSSSPEAVVPGSKQAARACLCAIEHASKAVRALRHRRTLQDSQEAAVNLPEAVVSSLAATSSRGACICGEADCLASDRDKHKDHDNTVHPKGPEARVCNLISLLAESYLQLAQACSKEGKIGQALKAAEVACLVLGGLPLPGTVNEASTTKPQSSKSRRSRKAKHKAATSSAKVEPESGSAVTSTERAYRLTSRDGRSFLGTAWALAGEMLVQLAKEATAAQQIASSSSSDMPSKGPAGVSPGRDGSFQVSADVAREVKRLKEVHKDNKQGDGVLIAGDLEDEAVCFACRSSRCTCLPDRTEDEMTASTSGDYSSATESGHSKKGTAVAEDGAPSTVSALSLGQCFGLELELDAMSSLRSAALLYFRAGTAFSTISDSAAAADAQRKEAWCHNELGRRQVQTSPSEAEKCFLKAIESFQRAGDVQNAVLALCNLGHGARARAEALLKSVQHTKESDQTHLETSLLAVRVAYAAALKWYCAARDELCKVGGDVGKQLPGPWEEAHKQLANTYLRVGMFLCQHRQSIAAQDEEPDDPLTGIEALSKALVLYKAMGEKCRQEAAYAHHQLAHGHKQESLARGAADQQDTAQRHASLAETHWQKALEVYAGAEYLDMAVMIFVERAQLVLQLNSSKRIEELVGSLQLLWEAKDHLLKCMAEEMSDSSISLSAETSEAYATALRKTLKEILAQSSRLEADAKSSQATQSVTFTPRGKGMKQSWLIVPLQPWKEAYRKALMLRLVSEDYLKDIWQELEELRS